MSIRKLLPFLPAPVHGNRSSLTCRMKCGDACFHEVPNTSTNDYFADVVAVAVSRRGLLRAGAVIGAVAAVGTTVTNSRPIRALAAPSTGGSMDFTAIKPQTSDTVVIPDGWSQDVVIRWGDKLFSSAPDFDPLHQSAEAQAQQFGYNNDFLGFFPLDDEHELMLVNHEYTDEIIMFPGYDATKADAKVVATALAAHGLTVVAVKKQPGTGRLTPVIDHKLNKRHTGSSRFELSGPIAGTSLVRTSKDPSGRIVEGTLNNCSGGLTPWGTWLSGEENFNQYFANAAKAPDAQSVARHKRYGIATAATERHWEDVLPRFDIAKEPNEVHRFGWLLEVNPWDPQATPRKRTALGRYKHEAGTAVIAADGRAVVYSGDDERFDYLYKFVSDAKVDMRGDLATRARANADLLDHGTLYVAKFTGNSPADQITGDGKVPADGAFDGTGQWLPLVHSDGDRATSLVPGMSAEEALVFTRLAGDAAGATKMDRPEDVETNPANGKIYMALTNNTKRTAAQTDEANPRGTGEDKKGTNKDGHVVEMTPTGGDHGSTTFGWTILLLCGDPNDASTYFAGFDKSQVSPISCPDNVTFDPEGNLWIATDGNTLGSHDGLYKVPLVGAERGHVQQFLSMPTGAECCGPWVNAERVNVAVQHPGEVEDATFEKPASHWPDGGSTLPRPAIVTAWPNRVVEPTSPAPTTTAPTSPAPTSTASTAPAPSGTATVEPTSVPSQPTRPGLPKTGR